MIDLIKSYTSRELDPSDTLEDAGIDAIDRNMLAMDIEDALGLRLTDCEIKGWRYVSDVLAYGQVV